MAGRAGAGGGVVRAAALLVSVLLVTGCNRKPVTVAPVKLECPKPAQVSRPVLAIQTLPKGAPPAVVTEAWADSVTALAAYAQQLEILLYGHTLPPAQPEPPK